jgi:hypothetical protein
MDVGSTRARRASMELVMSLRSFVVSIEPVALGAVIIACAAADAVMLELGVRCDPSRRLVFRVHGTPYETPDGAMRIEVEDARVVRGGIAEMAEASSQEAAELVAESWGELCVVVKGRVRLVACVALRPADDGQLSFRVVAGADPSTRPTYPSARFAA